MSNEVSLTGRAELDEIYKALQKINEHSTSALKSVGKVGQQTNDQLQKSTKKTEDNIKKTGNVLRRLASTLFADFKALASLKAIGAGMSLANQFSGSLKESLALNDTVRRLGNSFGVARKDFGNFQADLARGLGDIGASAEATANALEGLAGKGVEGMGSVKNLAKGAVTLAGIGGEKGNEKSIAAGIASAIQSQGKNVNDIQAQNALIGEVTAAVTSTGKSTTEILGAMNDIFASMPQELRKNIGPAAMAQLATVTTTAGPGATKALQEYLGKTKEQRMGMEAQGFNVFKGGKIDMAALQGFIKTTEGRGISPRASLQSAGFSEEAAEGLVRLGEKADLVQKNLDKLSKASRDNEEAFRETMGFVDAFKGSINTVKGWMESTFKGVSQSATALLSHQVGHAGSAAVVAGGALAATVLTGMGVKKISEILMGKTVGGLAGGLYKGAAAQMLTGKEVQPVYVVNADEISSGDAGTKAAGLLGGMGGLKGMGGMAMKGAGVGLAGYAGYEVGSQLVNPALDKYTQGKNDNGFEGNAAERFFAKLDQWSGGALSGTTPAPRIVIETKEPNLVPRFGPTRGISN